MSPQQSSSNRLVSLTATTSTQVSNLVSGSMVRTQLIIANTSAASTVTVTKGEVNIATAQAGITLLPNSVYYESTDGGYVCWQGAVQAYASADGQLSIVESFVDISGV